MDAYLFVPNHLSAALTKGPFTGSQHKEDESHSYVTTLQPLFHNLNKRQWNEESAKGILKFLLPL